MNKRAFFLLLVLWLAFRAAVSAYYDPTTKSFLSRDPIREAGGINLYAYCGNDPVTGHDPIGLQMPSGYNPFPGWPVTGEDLATAQAIYGMQQQGYSPQTIQQATSHGEVIGQMSRDMAKGYVLSMGIVATPVLGPQAEGGVGILADAMWFSGSAMLQRIALNGIDSRPLSQGVPETGAAAFIFGGVGSGGARLASGEFASTLRLPNFLRSSPPSFSLGGFPLEYQGGPGAMWIGENLSGAPLTAAELRMMPGVATGGENLSNITGQWLRGTEGNAGVFPKQIAEQLRGVRFNSFDEFRGAFWQKVAADPVLAPQFSMANRTLMNLGKAPFAISSQVTGAGFA